MTDTDDPTDTFEKATTFNDNNIIHAVEYNKNRKAAEANSKAGFGGDAQAQSKQRNKLDTSNMTALNQKKESESGQRAGEAIQKLQQGGAVSGEAAKVSEAANKRKGRAEKKGETSTINPPASGYEPQKQDVQGMTNRLTPRQRNVAEENLGPADVQDREQESAANPPVQVEDRKTETETEAPKDKIEQPQDEQPKPEAEDEIKPESAQDAYLNAITPDEWDATNKMLGDIGVAGMDTATNALEMMDKQYGALTALAAAAQKNPASLSTASQAVTSTMTGLAAMNSFVDKTAQNSLGVKPGVSVDKLQDQLAVKGAGWYRDRDKAAAAEKYVTNRLDQTIKDVLGPNGDITNISDEQAKVIQTEMERWLTPIYREIMSRPSEGHSMTDKAYINAYNAMNRGVGKLSKQAGANQRMVRQQLNQQKQQLNQQAKQYKQQLDDPGFIMQSIDNDSIPEALKLDAYSTLYNHLNKKIDNGVPLTADEMKHYENLRRMRSKRLRMTGIQARQNSTRTDFTLDEIRNMGNSALDKLKIAISEGRKLSPNEIRAMNGYLDEMEAYNTSYLGQSQPVDAEDTALYNAILAFEQSPSAENAQKLTEMKQLGPYIPPKKQAQTEKTGKKVPETQEINIEQQKQYWEKVLNSPDSSEQTKDQARKILRLLSTKEVLDEEEQSGGEQPVVPPEAPKDGTPLTETPEITETPAEPAGLEQPVSERSLAARDLLDNPTYYGKTKDNKDEWGLSTKPSTRTAKHIIGQIPKLQQYLGTLDDAIEEFEAEEPDNPILNELKTKRAQLADYLDKAKKSNIYTQISDARKKLTMDKKGILKLNRATGKDDYIKKMTDLYGQLDDDTESAETVFGNLWDKTWTDEDKRLEAERIKGESDKKAKEEAKANATREALRNDDTLIDAKLGVANGTLRETFKQFGNDKNSKARLMDYLFDTQLPDGTTKPGALGSRIVASKPEFSELTPERIGALYDRWANGELEKKDEIKAPKGDEKKTEEAGPSVTRYDDDAQLQKVIKALSRGALGRDGKVYKTKRGGLEYLQGLMSQPFEGHKTLSELYDESLGEEGKPNFDAFINQILPGKNGVQGHPVYNTLNSKNNTSLRDLYNTWTMLREKFPQEFQKPAQEAATEQPTGTEVPQEVEDAETPPAGQGDEPDELAELLSNAGVLLSGSPEAKRFEQRFNTDLSDGTNLFRSMNGYENEMDLSDLLNDLKMTSAGQEYGDRLQDVLYAVQDYIRTNPEVLTVKKSIPSIDELMGDEIEF